MDDSNVSENYTLATITCEIVADYCYRTFYNVSTEKMEDCFLNLCFEPRTMRPVFLYPITALYSLILFTGVVGNVATCFVMTAGLKDAQTSTNRYLLNLAIADLVCVLSGVPFEVYLGWNQYPWHPPEFVCHAKAWLLEATSYVSVLTILAFSVERYCAICYSFRAASKLVDYRKRITYVLAFIWLVAGLCAAPYSFYHRADYIVQQWPNHPEYGPVKETKMCMLALAFDGTLKPTFQFMFHFSAIVFFFIPLLFLIVMYARMARMIRKSRRTLRNFDRVQACKTSSTSANGNYHATTVKIDSNESSVITENGMRFGACVSQDYDSRKVFYMLAAVVVSFFLCYAPYQLQRLLFFYIDDNSTHQTVNTYLYLVSGVLFYLSSVLNPILYNLISSRFRVAFGQVLCGCGQRSAAAASVAAKSLKYSNISSAKYHTLIKPRCSTRGSRKLKIESAEK